MMNKIRTKEEEEFRKKRKERTIKSLSRAAKVKHRRRRWNKVRKKRPYIRQAIYQIGERNEGTKETVVGSKKKKLSSSRFFIHLSKRSLFVRYYLLFVSQFFSLPPFLPSLLFLDSANCRRPTKGFIVLRARFWSICSTFRA